MTKNAKKAFIVCLTAVLTFTLAACGQAADITWEELCAANRPEAILEQAGAYCVIQGGGEYMLNVAMKDGNIIWSQDNGAATEDYRDGVTYRYLEDNGITAEVTFLPHDIEPVELVRRIHDIDLEKFSPKSIRLQGGKYRAKVRAEDEEYGIVYTGTAVFDAGTLLLDTFDIRMKWGLVRETGDTVMQYGEAVSFEQPSYEAITRAEDALNVTVHFPDGSVRECRLTAEAELTVWPVDGDGYYSICIDEACTGSTDDLAWVEGDSADLYICSGEVPSAPPTMSRVLERSGFDYLFRENYDSYSQYFTGYDGDDNWQGDMGLDWILNEDGEMEYYAEAMDGEGEVIFSEMGADGVWYSWSRDSGYSVDFYGDSSYAEERMDAYRFRLNEEHLKGGLHRGEYYWQLCHAEEGSDGTLRKYTYNVSPDFDYIDLIYVDTYDSSGKLLLNTQIQIGGNGGIYADRDIRQEITEPEDEDTVKLTLHGTGGKTVKVRADAAISYQGDPLYSDEQCTVPVGDLSRAGSSATVYHK